MQLEIRCVWCVNQTQGLSQCPGSIGSILISIEPIGQNYMDLAEFVRLMQQQFSSSVRMCRLAVPDDVLLSESLLRAVRSRG